MGQSKSRRASAVTDSSSAESSIMSTESELPSGIKARWQQIEPWFGLLVRLVLAGIVLWAGLSKITDLQSSVLAVRAYELLPQAFGDFVGYALPFGEILLGLFLLFGLGTRYAAAANALLMLAFIFGISWAWSHGLNIDCGCFGGGGVVAPTDSQGLTYLTDIIRDVFIVAGSVFLIIRPRTKFSLDSVLDIS